MYPREEIEAAIEQYLALRNAAIAGERPWTDLATVLTEDVEFTDSVWGKHVGLAAVTSFLHDSMQGLDDWDFPHLWQVIDGDTVVLGWANRLPGRRDDGTYFDIPGASVLRYAGDGKFSSEIDMYSESQLQQVWKESGWVPTAPLGAPPPDRVW
ncbi:MAG: nuclear transport factor 2 family protein [Acidimicrobiales bacterium]